MTKAPASKMIRWKTVRAFVSSTFRDFHAERDFLVKKVFPEIRQWCHQWKLHFVEIDLRWGVTEEQAKSGKVIDICLQEVDDARPFFICLLGNRYGWVPSANEIPGDTVKKYSKLLLDEQMSITHMEIHHAVFDPLTSLDHNEANPHAFFYFRNENCIPDPDSIRDFDKNEKEEIRQVFFEEQKESIHRLNQLKSDVRKHYEKLVDEKGNPDLPNERVYVYSPRFVTSLNNPEDDRLKGRFHPSSLKDLGERVKQDLIQAIRNQFSNRISILSKRLKENPLESELDLHDSFVENRTKLFVGRKNQIRMILDYLKNDSTKVLAVYGKPGSGKSSLLSRCYHLAKVRSEKEIPDQDGSSNIPLLIPHFVGASPESTSLRHLLEKMCRVLKNTFGIQKEIPITMEKIKETFHDFLEKVDRDVYIFIDGLNQLDENDRFNDLEWLPDILPGNVKIVVSTLPGKYQQALNKKTNRYIKIPRLTDEERFEIIEDYPTIFSKTLDKKLINLLLQREDTRNPLYLRVVLEELRVFGSFEMLEQKILNLPDDLTDLFVHVLERLESEHDSLLVKKLFCLLESSRHGLTHIELTQLLADDSELEHRIILRQIRNYLFDRGNVIDFFHDSLSKAVRKKYYKGKPSKTKEEDSRCLKWHRVLAKFFQCQPLFLDLDGQEPNERKCIEQPWQMARAEEWGAAIDTLCDLAFIEARCNVGLIYEFIDTYRDVRMENEHHEILCSYSDFLHQNIHILKDFPHLTLQQAANFSKKSIVATEARKDPRIDEFTWIEQVNKADYDTSLSVVIESASFSCGFLPDGKRIFNGYGIWSAENGSRITMLHKSIPFSMGVSKNGRLIAAGYGEGEVRIWNADTYEEMLIIEGGGANLVCSFSPDGEFIAAGGFSSQSKVAIYRTTDGTKINELPCHQICHYSPDGNLIVTDSQIENGFMIWDAHNFKKIHTIPYNKNHFMMSCCSAFSPNYKQIIVSSGNTDLTAWNIENKEVIAKFSGHKDEVVCCAFSPDGSRIVSGSKDHSLIVWDAKTYEPITQILADSEAVKSCEFSLDGKRILSCGTDGIKIWDLKKAIEQNCATQLTHHDCVTSCTINSRQHELVTTSKDTQIKLWSLQSGVVVQTLDEHTNIINDCCFSPSKDNLITVSDDHTLKIWNPRDGYKLICSIELDHCATNCCFTPDGSRIILSFANRVGVIDAEEYCELGRIKPEYGRVKSISISPDGRFAIVGASQFCVLFDIATCKVICDFYNPGKLARNPYGLSFSPDGTLIAIASGYFNKYSHRGCLYVDDLVGIISEGDSLNTSDFFWEFDCELSSLHFSPDGRQIMAGIFSGTKKGRPFGNEACVWSIQSRKELFNFGSNEGQQCFFSNDGRRIITWTRKWICVHDALNGKVLSRFSAQGPSRLSKENCDGWLSAGSNSGYVHILKQNGVDFGAPIVTPVFLYHFDRNEWSEVPSVTCKWCYERFQLPTNLFDKIKSLHQEEEIGIKSPILNLPGRIWEEPELFFECPKCGDQLKSNPFIFDLKHRWADSKGLAARKANYPSLRKQAFLKSKINFDKDLERIKELVRNDFSVRKIAKILGYSNHISLNSYIRKRGLKKRKG